MMPCLPDPPVGGRRRIGQVGGPGMRDLVGYFSWKVAEWVEPSSSAKVRT
jgi:hypothetical protein